MFQASIFFRKKSIVLIQYAFEPQKVVTYIINMNIPFKITKLEELNTSG